MKNIHLPTTLLLMALLLSIQSTAIADDSSSELQTTKPLILAIESQNITGHFARTDTYTSQYDRKSHIEGLTQSKIDTVTKTLKKVSRAFKRITSIRYGKSKKIRAKLGKTSLTLRYTYVL